MAQDITNQGFYCNNETYIRVLSDTPIIRDGIEDERFAVKDRVFKVVKEDGGGYYIKIGCIEGWMPSRCAEKLEKNPGQKIMLAWDHIPDRESNTVHRNRYINVNSVSQGLDVISPTWFTRIGDARNPEGIRVVEKCDREYVKTAHRHGYEVWGLIADFDPDRNFAVFSNEALVSREIEDILKYSLEYNLDGINIDFEGFGSRCREVYSEYVKKLSHKLKEHNLIVSIDITKESDSDAWGKCYDRAELSKYIDFIAYMAYDEYGRLDVVPGSTGSLPWVEEGILELLNMGISKDKILLGVPFYTRDWKVKKVQFPDKCAVVTEWEDIGLYDEPDTSMKKYPVNKGAILKYLGETGEWIKVEQDSKEYYIKKAMSRVLEKGETMYLTESVAPLPMKEITKIIDEYRAKPVYDDYAMQRRIVYTDRQGFEHLIWAEDDASMEERLKLVNKYNLPGAAAWALSQETDTVWDVVKKMLK